MDGIFKFGAALIGLFDDSDEKKAEVALHVQKMQNEYNLLLEQVKANAAQANHRSIFVAGARPCMMWFCVIGVGSEVILRPWVMAFWPHIVIPNIPFEVLLTFIPLFGIPAVSRSWEKNKNLTK